MNGLEGEIEETAFELYSEESRTFWSSVWIKAKVHNKKAEWLDETEGVKYNKATIDTIYKCCDNRKVDKKKVKP